MLGVGADSEESSAVDGDVSEADDMWADLFEEEELGEVIDLEAEWGVNADDLSSEDDEVLEPNPKRRKQVDQEAEAPKPDNPTGVTVDTDDWSVTVDTDDWSEDIDDWSEVENDPTTTAEVRYPPDPGEPTPI